MNRPNLVFIFADEWRAQALGHAGDPNVHTPHMDAFARQSVEVDQAVSGSPICCPYRASLFTGQYLHRHGVVINDVELNPNCDSLPRAFAKSGYENLYIGKWHLYGSPDGKYGRRRVRVPRSHQLGFDHWFGFECTHDYNNSPYFIDDDPTQHHWKGYDAEDQTTLACDLIRQRAGSDRPFSVFLSWGPPHFPLETAPEFYRKRLAHRPISLRPNVPAHLADKATEELRGYYAHIEALDDQFARLMACLEECGLSQNTIVVLTSDHGELRRCHGLETKLAPFEESLRVPFFIRWPQGLGSGGRIVSAPLDSPDLFPTLASLCKVGIPSAVQGRDWSPELRGERPVAPDVAAYCLVPAAIAEMRNYDMGGWRGLRSQRWSYHITANGPWLLHDLQEDPYQLRNLVENPAYQSIRIQLHEHLMKRMHETDDDGTWDQTLIEARGLSHYKEANAAAHTHWRSPWNDDPAWLRAKHW